MTSLPDVATHVSRTTPLRISGYASLFNIVDLSGDRVRPGAFAASLLLQSAIKIPMLYGHDTARPIGVWDRVVEDRSGLFVSGHLFHDPPHSDRHFQSITSGAVSGLSIGYRVKRAVTVPGRGRDLLELDLWEISVVAFPMLRAARITQISDFPSTPLLS